MFFKIDFMFDTTNSFFIFEVLLLISELRVSMSRLLMSVFIVAGSLLVSFYRITMKSSSNGVARCWIRAY